ncbi:hypothetical protein PENSPDRAFT_230320 [Peniophora sp. CONT]|nr:hypothetical protein PENSPDRAFT_230320 [Peniophora sp. CONT]
MGYAATDTSSGAPFLGPGRMTPGAYSGYAPTTSGGSHSGSGGPNDALSESSHYPPSTIPSDVRNYYYGATPPPGAMGMPMPMPGPMSSSSEGSGPHGAAWAPPRNLKEREAQRMRVANNDFVQHTDGGRVPEEDVAAPSEIPPSYDSIPDDRR